MACSVFGFYSVSSTGYNSSCCSLECWIFSSSFFMIFSSSSIVKMPLKPWLKKIYTLSKILNSRLDAGLSSVDKGELLNSSQCSKNSLNGIIFTMVFRLNREDDTDISWIKINITWKYNNSFQKHYFQPIFLEWHLQ